MSLATTLIALKLETRAQQQVSNWMDTGAPSPGLDMLANKQKEDFRLAIHRPTKTSITYNCHGLTFAARRAWIDKASQVQEILQQDGYIKVEGAPSIGDVAIYRSQDSGDIEHSGIVVDVPLGGLAPVILSKWGRSHEVVHAANYSPYQFAVEYYRIVR